MVPLDELEEWAWDTVMNVNLKGTWLVSKEVVKMLKEQKKGGSIINMTSYQGFTCTENLGAYCTSKAAVAHLTKCMSNEWGKYNIRVNAVGPTWVYTALSAPLFDNIPGFKEPPGVKVQCVAPVVVYLASDAAQEITGQIIAVRGNKIAMMSPAREVAAIYAEKEIWTPQQISEVFPAALKPWMTKPGLKVMLPKKVMLPFLLGL
jgi:2-deoxy-D-gluconate 3-dehydrogenase